MMKKILNILFLVFVSGSLSAQSELTLYNLEYLPQATYHNLGTTPKHKFYLSLPVLGSNYLSAGNSGFSFSDIYRVRDDDSTVIDLKQIADKVNKRNYLHLMYNTDLLGMHFKAGKSFISFGANEKVSVKFTYPRDLVGILAHGNGEYVNKRASMDGIALNLTHYREYYLGYTRQFTDELTIGVRPKFLYGMENIYTKRNSLGLYTNKNEGNALTIDAAYEIHTSSIRHLLNDSFSSPYDDVSGYLLNLKNRGFAFDAGGSFKTGNLSFTMNFVDFGFINWKENLRTYRIDNFEYTYPGVEFKPSQDFDSYSFDEFADSMSTLFTIQESSEEYSTTLPVKVFLSASYHRNEISRATFLIHNEFIGGFPRTELSLAYTTQLKKFLSVSGSYSVINGSFNNLGFGFATGGPVQFYVISDNILSFLIPDKTKIASTRFGFNLAFGRKAEKKTEEPANPE
jgi:hypothetical protein